MFATQTQAQQLEPDKNSPYLLNELDINGVTIYTVQFVMGHRKIKLETVF